MNYYVLKHSSFSFVYGDATLDPHPGYVYYNRAKEDRLPPSTEITIKMTSSVRVLQSDFFPINIGYVVSEAFIEPLKLANPLDFNLYPSKVMLHNGKPVEGTYYFLEILKWVDCFDFQNSSYDHDSLFEIDEDEPVVRKCSSMELREGTLADTSIAFVEHVAFSYPIINSELHES